MDNRLKVCRSFFAVGLIAIAVQQFICTDFRPVIMLPAYPTWLHDRYDWACLFGFVLIIACTAIMIELKAKQAAIFIGLLLLLLVIIRIPGQPYPKHVGSWTDALKELALCGGALVVAGSFVQKKAASTLTKLFAKLIPVGKCFFALTMIVFGFAHFLYTDFVAPLVPTWIPGHTFWTYFAGVALMAGGLGIMFNIKRRIAANLMGIMIFLWLLMLHIPRAIADPHSGTGNEWTSVFEALAFSGIAFLIAAKQSTNP